MSENQAPKPSGDIQLPFPKYPQPLWWRCSSSLLLGAITVISKFWLSYLSYTSIYRKKIIQDLMERPKNVPLITVSNHHSCIDDPLLSSMLKWTAVFNPSKIRWTPVAHDVCYMKKWHAMFFGLTRAIPVVRGAGVFQRGMDYTLKQLNNGEWIHIFPEGKINVDKTWIRFKWGVGRLVHESKHTPIVVPIYHLGMDDVLPNNEPYYPRIGKKVTILIGQPLHLEKHLQKCQQLKMNAMQIRKSVTDIIQDELEKLRIEAEELHNMEKSTRS